MTRSKEIFADGDVIFREGETSDRAYEIFSGKVEILKDEGGKPVHQGYLGPGEMFGEMAVLDGGVHGATARAVGRTVVRSMDRGGLIDSMQQTPESTLGMMGRLIKRLRGGKPAPAPAADGASYSNPSLLRRLIDGLGTDQERIGVRVKPLVRTPIRTRAISSLPSVTRRPSRPAACPRPSSSTSTPIAPNRSNAFP